jgi:zinc transport system substrate-binding protein
MVVAVRRRGLEAGDPVAHVDALNESKLGENFEHAVHGRDPDRTAALAEALVNLLSAGTAVLPCHQVEDGRARTAGAEARLTERCVGVLAPAAKSRHREDDSDSHRRASLDNVRIVLTLICVAVLAGCGGDSSSEGRNVVVSFYPLALATEQIGGDEIDVRNLTPPGVEPHDFELSGSDIRALADADLVLFLGGGFQPALEDAIDSISAHAVDLLDAVETREGDEHQEHEGEEEEHGVDPHVWLDPIRYAAIAERIGEELDRRPEADRFAAALRTLDRDFRRGLSGCERDEIVTSHAAFGYLAERYGLRQVPITGVSPEAEPTPRDLEKVVRQVRAVGATTVFFETLVSPRLAETVAREVDAEIAVLDPLEGLAEEDVAAGEDYFSVMRENLAALRKALGCR